MMPFLTVITAGWDRVSGIEMYDVNDRRGGAYSCTTRPLAASVASDVILGCYYFGWSDDKLGGGKTWWRA